MEDEELRRLERLSTPSLGITEVRGSFLVARKDLSTPSLGITSGMITAIGLSRYFYFQLPLSGSLAAAQSGAVPLSRHSEAFNSLSRDHGTRSFSVISLKSAAVLSTPSLGITPILQAKGEIKYWMKAFNSLSRDHRRPHTFGAGCARSAPFQLPLSGSPSQRRSPHLR